MPKHKDENARSQAPLSAQVFHILLALTDRDRHGYGIIKEVMRSTDGQLRLSTGTLYAAIKRLLAQGLIDDSEYRPDPDLDDERRRYYKLTELGREIAREEARRLVDVTGLALAKHLLSDSDLPGGDGRRR